MRTMIAMALLTLAACGQAPESTVPDEPQRLVAEAPRGKTFDNPFGGNAAAPEDADADMTASDGPDTAVAPPMAEPERESPASTPIDPPASTPMATDGRSCNDGKRVCGDMDGCEDAQFHLRQCGMRRLDGDSDGVPCEKICG